MVDFKSDIEQIGIKKVEPKSRALEALKRLKNQESFGNSFSRLPKVERMIYEQPKTIQQHNVQYLLERINNIEKKMKEDSGEYLNLYYDLNLLEKKFIKAVDELRKFSIKVPDLLSKEIDKRYYKISKKFGEPHDV